MRLIDADKLYRKFGVYTEKASMECTKAKNENERKVWDCIKEERSTACKMIWNEPTVNQWIPVSEGLPKKGDFVLVTLYDDLLSEWERRDVTYVEIASYNERADYYEGLHFFDSEWEKLDTVTAWMPLPKPHEVKKE